MGNIVTPQFWTLPQVGFALNRFAPGLCCCGPSSPPGCSNPPDGLNQSNIPPTITVTLGNCVAVRPRSFPCLEGRRVTLQYERCMRYSSSLFIYYWGTTLGTCPDGKTYGVRLAAFVGIIGSCYTTHFLYEEGTSGYICQSTSSSIAGYHGISVAEVVQLGASIGGGGDTGGIWCNGYGDASVGFEICKSKNNTGPYDDGGYYYPDACCADKGPTELICTVNGWSDVVTFEMEDWGSCANYHQPYKMTITAMLSQWGSKTVTLDWGYLQCGTYNKGFGGSIPDVPFRQVVENLDEGHGYRTCCSDWHWYCDKEWVSDTCELQIFLPIGGNALMRIVDNWYGCKESGWIVKSETFGGGLPDCQGSDYNGVSVSGWGTLNVSEAVYCDIP